MTAGPDTGAIAARLRQIRARIDRAAEAHGSGPVTLVAVSKRHPPAAIRAAYQAGQRDFGENYAQELRDKRETLADLPDLRWHFVGALKSNKVKYVLGCASIQTVDRVSLLETIDRRATVAGLEQDVLVELNLGEANKAGVSREALPALLDAFARCQATQCRGLMVIPPPGTATQSRAHFEGVAALARSLAATPRPRVSLHTLSMGMSADFESAIAAGATLVRVGTAIFGARTG